MIVRNESHIIRETLDNLCSYIQFEYWVIVDTGSTDNTIQLIRDFFNEKSIPGELHETKWVDFGFNRSHALELAYDKSDYLLIFDADDKIKGNFKLPMLLDVDKYNLRMGSSFEYYRPLFINNHKRWKFEGVLHEYLTNIDEVHGEKNIDGDYYILSGRNGARNKNPHKYRDDALVLEKAYHAEKTKNVSLANRYAFYCAQSYKDAGSQYIDSAIKWYELALSVCTWNQEKYYSSLMLGNLYKQKDNLTTAYKYWMNTVKYDQDRIEAVVHVMEHMMNNGLHIMVNLLYHKYKHYHRTPSNKLFLSKKLYNHHIEFYNAVSAYYAGDHSSGYECIKQILLANIIDESKYKITLKNLTYYKKECAKDPDITALFDMVDHKLYTDSKRQHILSEAVDAWNTLFEIHRKRITIYRPYTTQNSDTPTIFFSITTCKRLDLFKQTMNSILNQWTDVSRIDYWYCVDDNSTESDRDEMKRDYPWMDYYMKTIEEKGHRTSMNLIWTKLRELNPTYWIHMEDDFLFHLKMDYIGTSINALDQLSENNVKQILFNRNYAETIDGYSILGHVDTSANQIVLHQHNETRPSYRNCHYWPHYSFRPSMILTSAIMELGDYDSANQFFEMDYAKKWADRGYKSAFFDRITNRHIGRLTNERKNTALPNAYALNQVSQFTNDPGIPIRILNLKRRPDRNQEIQKLFQREQITQYQFTEAVDGKELEPSEYLYSLFKGNDFGTKRGVMGCALSHYTMWKDLIADDKNDYYLIFEDDIQVVHGIKPILDQLDTEMKKKDVVFLGYSMFSNKRKEVFSIYNQSDQPAHIEKLNRSLYIGGTFAYSINKIGAQKLVSYIQTSGIKHGIDYLMKIAPGLECFECQPQLVFSEWNENGKAIDTDIQNRNDCMIFPFKMVANVEISQIKSPVPLSNTTTSVRPIRIKLMCNWCTSKQLCVEWSPMCHQNYRWQNLEITWDNKHIDYYVIVNRPPANEYFVPEKTIVFQMEPWVLNTSSNWGVKTWGKWAEPDPAKFLAVRGRKTKCHNNAYWQLELTCRQLERLTYLPKKDIVSSICSSKYFDEGHIHRIDFLKFLEAKGDVKLNIYNKDNKHMFKNYKGRLTPGIDKSKGIVPFKYYFMVENNYEPDFITEKLWEPILCESLVFYYGCPNTSDYIDDRAYVQLDMHDFEKSYQIVKQAIAEDWWSQRIEYIRTEKKKILNELAFFPTIQSIIQTASDKVASVSSAASSSAI